MIHNRNRISATLAVTLALLAGAAVPAMARPDVNLAPTAPQTQPSTPGSTNLCSEVCFGGGRGFVQHQVGTSAALSSTRPHTSQPPVARVVIQSTGFDWGDAAIGAGGAIVLVLVALGGGRIAMTHRTRPLAESRVSAAR
jgi:hypothetical protein